MPPILPTRSLYHRDTDIGALHPSLGRGGKCHPLAVAQALLVIR